MRIETLLTNNFRRGRKLLDKKLPDWRDKINLDTFEISDPKNCIFGQLFNGCYSDGYDTLRCDPTRSGFETDPRVHNTDWSFSMQYEFLNNLWREEIDTRTSTE